MSTEMFTDSWAKRWAEELNGCAEYRQAASDWHGSICFQFSDRAGSGEKSVFLDLDSGVCNAARAATAVDIASAKYLLVARERVWRRLIEGRADPLIALMTGMIRFERGRLTDFAHHGAAAKELMLAARRIGGGS